MKNKLKYSFIIFFSLLVRSLESFCQTNDLIKTTEYLGKEKRRDMILNKELNIVQESYYSSKDQQIVNTIYYDNSGNLKRIIGYKEYPKVTFDIDLENGNYEIPENKTVLKFKNWFNFDGLQRGDNILVNYLNGKRQGRLVQTDSAEFGSKTVVYQRPNVALLNRFNILQFYNEIGEEDTYKVYKGLILNFKNNQLNGRQLGYYVSGTPKIKAIFKNGKVLNYSSFSQDGNTLTNISTDSNAIVKKPYIINGIIERDKLNVSFKNSQLENTGNIYFENDFLYEKGGWNDFRNFKFEYEDQWKDGKYIGKTLGLISNRLGIEEEQINQNFQSDEFLRSNMNFKKWFDDSKYVINENNPHILRVLFKIPFYKLNRYDFENKDQSDLEIIEKTAENSEELSQLSTSNKEYEDFYKNIINAIKFKNPEYNLLPRLDFNNWINAPIDMNELYTVSNKSWEGLKNKKSSLGVKQESLVQFAKIFTLMLKAINQGNSKITQNELTELGLSAQLNMAHSFLVLSNFFEDEYYLKTALSFYSKVPLDYNFKLFDNASTESIIQNDWKELIKNSMLDKSITKNIDLKNLPKD